VNKMLAIVLGIPALLIAVLLDLVKGELRERIERMPYALLRLARLLVPIDLRESLHDEEWLPELQHILDASEGLPLTRLLRGIRYALGLIRGARAVARELAGVRRSPMPAPGPRPAFDLIQDLLVRRFRQWEHAATRSPNPTISRSAPLDAPTMEAAAELVPRLDELRARLRRDGIDQHRRPVGNLEEAALGWLWEEWRDGILGDRNGYRYVWTDPLYGSPARQHG
jgi:hypothetical protein